MSQDSYQRILASLSEFVNLVEEGRKKSDARFDRIESKLLDTNAKLEKLIERYKDKESTDQSYEES